MAASHKQQFISGVAYTAAAKYAGLIIQLGISAVLARLLPPVEFGIVAVATVIINFFFIFSDMGFGPAIVQRKHLTDRDLDNIFSFTCWTGLGLAALFFGCAWWIADFYDAPRLVPVCHILSLQLLFSCTSIVPNALFYRDKKFKFLAVRTLSVQAVTGAAAIVMALMLSSEQKVYALAAQPALATLLVFAVNMRTYPRRLRITLGLSTIRSIFSYSAYQFLFNLINYFGRNLDKLLIGKWLDMTQLGYYDKSYRMMMLPLQNVTQVLTPVMHPVFSEMQHELQTMLSKYLKVVRLLALIGFPLSVLLVFGGRELILLLFGMQWEPSVAAFRILALSVGIQMVLSSSGSIFQAADDTRRLFFVGLASTLCSVAGMVVALLAFGTPEAVAWSVTITFAINFLICYITMHRATFRTGMGPFLRQLLSPLAAAALVLAALLPTAWLPEGMNMILSLAIKCAAAGIVWLAYIQLAGEFDIIGKIRSILRR